MEVFLEAMSPCAADAARLANEEACREGEALNTYWAQQIDAGSVSVTFPLSLSYQLRADDAGHLAAYTFLISSQAVEVSLRGLHS